MPRIPRGLVDGFIYHEAKKGSLSPFVFSQLVGSQRKII